MGQSRHSQSSLIAALMSWGGDLSPPFQTTIGTLPEKDRNTWTLKVRHPVPSGKHTEGCSRMRRWAFLCLRQPPPNDSPLVREAGWRFYPISSSLLQLFSTEIIETWCVTEEESTMYLQPASCTRWMHQGFWIFWIWLEDLLIQKALHEGDLVGTFITIYEQWLHRAGGFQIRYLCSFHPWKSWRSRRWSTSSGRTSWNAPVWCNQCFFEHVRNHWPSEREFGKLISCTIKVTTDLC